MCSDSYQQYQLIQLLGSTNVLQIKPNQNKFSKLPHNKKSCEKLNELWKAQ